MSEERILDKVKKMLAIANNSAATEGERDNALRMAHALLAKHNLSMENVHEREAMEGRETLDIETFRMRWARVVCNGVAKLFFCKYYSGEKLNATKGKHYFVGKQSNAITATLISSYVINSILKECRNRWQHNLAPESRSFCIGAADKLRDRIEEMMKGNDIEGVSAENAVVLYNIYQAELDANEIFIKAAGTNLVTKKARQQEVDLRYYAQGKEFGDRINLNGQVVNKEQLRIK